MSPPLSAGARLRWDVVGPWVAEAGDGAHVLEVGPGVGGLAARLAARGPYTGVEPDPASAEQARRRVAPHGGVVLDGGVEVLGPGRAFDVVAAFEVVEHLHDDVAAVRGWGSLLRPGGSLVLTTPAWPDRFGPFDASVGHLRRYTPRGLTRVVREAGLEVRQVRCFGWPLGYALEAARDVLVRRRVTSAGQDGGHGEVAGDDGAVGGAGADGVTGGSGDDGGLGTDGVTGGSGSAEGCGPAGSSGDAAHGAAEGSVGSGAVLQPGAVAGHVLAAAVVPFTWLQRPVPHRGTWLALRAVRPAG